MPEATVAITFNKNEIWKFGTLTVSPFHWLEAGYFYYRPADLRWEGDNVRGHYLDKGFNVKFVHRPKDNRFPTIAIGLDDFAGTGYFSKEYAVSTFVLGNFKSSLGIGWGKFAGESSFENPLSFISDDLIFRPIESSNRSRGGNPSYDKWFRGDASLFGGIEYISPHLKGLKIKLEYDPFNYFDFSAVQRPDALASLRNKTKNINFGIGYQLNDFVSIDASYIKGNTFNLNFNIALNFNKDFVKKEKFKSNIELKDFQKNSKNNFYENLLYNLNKNNLFLQTANLDKNELEITISATNYRNAVRSGSYAAKISQDVANYSNIDLSVIKVTHLNAGIELNQISFISNHLSNQFVPMEVKVRNTDISSGKTNSYISDEFQPILKMPIIFSSISPSVISHIGNPEKFYFGGLNLKYSGEIQFKRNLILTTELNQPIYNNLEDTISGPGSKMEHVRTDLVQYLKEDDIFISRAQLDFIWSPMREIYAKVSGGIFENMYAGIGGEILYKPFDKNYSIGFELFEVKQRDFRQRFGFKNYKTTTGHISYSHIFAKDVEAKISYGRYLAKDDGFTLDLGRRTRSGFKAGIYFSRTNVSDELFGEGSFDKGFYIQVPLDLFSNKYNGQYSTLKISPLTRDGGAKLIHDKDLRGLIHNSSRYELSKQWRGYLD